MDKTINPLFYNKAKLKWACRRGMLELDILLENFLKRSYMTLSLEGKTTFITLLNQPDPDLLSWLLGQQCPLNKKWQDLIEQIRRDNRARI